ncbi:MAG: hypothetical protein ACLTDR_11395 [Adlercreutzia equolifaciens]
MGVPLYLALSATMAVVMMLVLRGCVPSLRRLAWPLAVVQGLASVALVVPLLPASPSASIFYAVAAALAGAGVAWLYLQWAPFFASLGAKDVIACVFIAMAVGSALKVPLDMLPAPAAAIVLALLPAVSVASRAAPMPARARRARAAHVPRGESHGDSLEDSLRRGRLQLCHWGREGCPRAIRPRALRGAHRCAPRRRDRSCRSHAVVGARARAAH